MNNDNLQQGNSDQKNQDVPKESDITFTEWLFSEFLKKNIARSISIAFAILAGFNLALPFIIQFIKKFPILPFLYGTQALFIIIIAGIIVFGQEPKTYYDKYIDPDTKKELDMARGSNAVIQFWRWWPILWVAWALLYILLTLVNILPKKNFIEIGKNELEIQFWPWTAIDIIIKSKLTTPLAGHIIKVIMHFVNNIATLILLMIYHILAYPSLPEPGEKKTGKNNSDTKSTSGDTSDNRGIDHQSKQLGSSLSPKFMFWFLILITLVLIEIALLMYTPEKPSNWQEQILRVFGLFYGILAAMATALVVGRLDSKLLDVPKLVLIILCIYAGIQPAFDFLIAEGQINDPDYIFKALIIAVALVSKIVLFTTIHWLAMKGRLLFFMVHCYDIYKNIGDKRKALIKRIEEDKLQE